MYKSAKEKAYAVLDNATGKVVAIGGGLMVMTGNAMAGVPTSVTTAIETAGTDAATVASAVFVVIVGIFAIKLLRKGL